MEFPMFRFWTRNRKKLLKARHGETIIIKKMFLRTFTSNYFQSICLYISLHFIGQICLEKIFI